MHGRMDRFDQISMVFFGPMGKRAGQFAEHEETGTFLIRWKLLVGS